MSRLVVNPGTQQAWEIHLKPGANLLGRAESNDFKINDPSVSGSHCQVFVNGTSALLRDSGSTNGTYVAGNRIQEQRLQDGQGIRLGSVEMVFCAGDGSNTTVNEAKATLAASMPAMNPSPTPTSPPIPPPPTVRVAMKVAMPAAAPLSVSPPAAPTVMRLAPVHAASPATDAAEAPAAPAETLEETIAAVDVGARYCKYHRTSPARFLCAKCDLTFCDLCIQMSEIAGRTARTCRNCGTELTPAIFRPKASKGFYAKLPGAFGYPFRGTGVVILLCATIAFAGLNFVSAGIFGLLIRGALYGFVFLFMQNIILMTTSDESDELAFPDVSSLSGAAFQLFGTVVASFWLAIALAVAQFNGVDIPSAAIIGAVILGGIYFPMALLAVAMKDTVMAANPLIVVPAMLKVPGKYFVTVALLLMVFGVRQLGDLISSGAGKLALHTHDNSQFATAVGFRVVWALLSVYLLTVTMRILGLFYNGSKQRLGWFRN